MPFAGFLLNMFDFSKKDPLLAILDLATGMVTHGGRQNETKSKRD